MGVLVRKVAAQFVVTIPLALLLLTCQPPAFAGAAQGDAALFFDRNGIARLESEGGEVPRDGQYYVWVWGTSAVPIEIELAGTHLQTQPQQAVAKSPWGWEQVGRVGLKAKERFEFKAAPLGEDDPSPARPGFLALSTLESNDPAQALEVMRVNPDSPEPIDDKRASSPRPLEDGSGFDPTAFADRAAWQDRADAVRRQILVATGLWPMPPKTPPNPQVYGRIERDGYSIEKVVLETFPGFYLAGNLYRPTGENAKKSLHDGRRPGILSPHGHWEHGRFQPDVQARQIHLARMGAVVFAYDMVGYGDSKPFGHDFEDGEIDLLGIDLTGLQLWDSIRALDWLLTLPDVDAERIACTGASGGGTQTFLLTAVDDRVKVAAPVCMVSAAMQGGSECENAANLRVDTNNIEFAALAAPRPLLLVGATGDWTKEIETHGYPEIQQIYDLFGARELVHCEVHDFGHNYNQTSRESVYRWFSKHLFGHDGTIDAKELPFETESEDTLRCFTDAQPRPADALDKQGLKTYLKGVVAAQAEVFRPASAGQWQAARQTLSAGYQVRLPVRLPEASQVENVGEMKRLERGDLIILRGIVTSGRGDQVPYLVFGNRETLSNGNPCDATLVVHPKGSAALVEADGTPNALVRGLLKQGRVVAAIDPFLSGEHQGVFRPTERTSTRHLLCYNRATLVERVQDVLTALAGLRRHERVGSIDLIGVGEAGTWCLLALPHAPFVNRTVVDADQFDYAIGETVSDDRLLPGVLRFGGLRGFATLAAPAEVWVHSTGERFDASWMKAAYDLAGAGDKLRVSKTPAETADIVAWLTGR